LVFTDNIQENYEPSINYLTFVDYTHKKVKASNYIMNMYLEEIKKELVDIQKSNPYTHDDMDEIVRGYLF